MLKKSREYLKLIDILPFRMQKKRKKKVGFFVRLDEEQASFVVRFSARESRSPSNTVEYLVKKKIKELGGPESKTEDQNG